MPANYKSSQNDSWKMNKTNRVSPTPPVFAAVDLLKQVINTQSGTTYTLALGDLNELVLCSNGSAVTVTVPPNSTTAFEIGARIDVCQYGAGQVTIAPGAGVTLRSTPTLKTRAQYSTISCLKVATNEWLIVGDLAAV